MDQTSQVFLFRGGDALLRSNCCGYRAWTRKCETVKAKSWLTGWVAELDWNHLLEAPPACNLGG